MRSSRGGGLVRRGKKGHDWEPTNHHRVCGKNFVTGKPNPDPEHPDFIPSLFLRPEDFARSSNTLQKKTTNSSERHDGTAKRRSIDVTTESDPRGSVDVLNVTNVTESDPRGSADVLQSDECARVDPFRAQVEQDGCKRCDVLKKGL
ncbi:hypothetical protein SKAU_G00148950 [Synaphobranchus kaupii]|uniref:THAP-type domain-containing protein n=1 Tax=Synaphobranchus kaupii TaxID=118154 RepID=A0A9Q1J409_SYNKA|nr:hypothetical protein SKAU_G00148950 [Synaphobranchus kaupii]